MSRRSRHGEKECDFCRRRLACQGVAARTDSRPGFALTRFAVAVSAAARRRLAGATGLEPATYGVTGRHSNQLSYAPAPADNRAKGVDVGEPHSQVKLGALRRPPPALSLALGVAPCRARIELLLADHAVAVAIEFIEQGI